MWFASLTNASCLNCPAVDLGNSRPKRAPKMPSKLLNVLNDLKVWSLLPAASMPRINWPCLVPIVTSV